MAGDEGSAGLAVQLRLVLTIFRGWIGAAFVSMPYGFSHSGYVLATVTLLLLGWLSAYCAKLVLLAKYRRVGVHATYADLAEHVMGPRGVQALDALLLFCQSGFCVSYVIFIEHTLRALWSSLNVRLLALLLKVLLASLVLVAPHPRSLAHFSAVASALLFGGLMLCFSAFDWSLEATREISPVNVAGIPLFVGMACSAMTGIGIVVPFEAALYDQIQTVASFGRISFTTRVYLKCLYIAVALSTVILIAFGLAGSFTFGGATAAVISANLGPGKSTATIQMLLAASMSLAFPLQFLPVREISERLVFSTPIDLDVWLRRIWRASLVVLICFLSSVIPRFALVYSLVGGFAGCLLAFVFPLFIHMSLEHMQGGQFFFHALLLALSVVAGLVSTVSAFFALFQ